MAQTTEQKSLKDWSGWDYAPGIAFVVVGILALLEPPIASLATGAYLGVMLCVAGGLLSMLTVTGPLHRMAAPAPTEGRTRCPVSQPG